MLSPGHDPDRQTPGKAPVRKRRIARKATVDRDSVSSAAGPLQARERWSSNIVIREIVAGAVIGSGIVAAVTCTLYLGFCPHHKH